MEIESCLMIDRMSPQNKKLLERLQIGEWVSNVEIVKELYILRASERIRELRKMGYEIESRRVEGKPYQEYRLLEKPKTVLPPPCSPNKPIQAQSRLSRVPSCTYRLVMTVPLEEDRLKSLADKLGYTVERKS